MNHNHADIVRQFNDAFSRNELDAALAFCREDLRWTMVGEALLQSREEARTFMSAAPGEAPVLRIAGLLSDGDSVCCDGTMTLAGADGAAAQDYGFCDIYRFDAAGQIAEIRTYLVRIKTED
jgi:uncharacterized protein